MLKVLKAKYNSTCLICCGLITAGEDILWHSETGATIHPGCSVEGEDVRVTVAKAVRRRVMQELKAARSELRFSSEEAEAAQRYDAAVNYLRGITNVAFWLHAGRLLAQGKISTTSLLLEASRIVKGETSPMLAVLGAGVER